MLTNGNVHTVFRQSIRRRYHIVVTCLLTAQNFVSSSFFVTSLSNNFTVYFGVILLNG